MKKIAAPLLVVIVLALLLIPWLIGSGIQSSLAQNLQANIPPEVRNQWTITQTQYDKGWLTSQGQLAIGYSVMGEEPIQILLNLDIKHGPVLLTNNGLRFGTAYADVEPVIDGQTLSEALAALTATPPDIDISLLTGFSQSVEMALDVAPFGMMEAGTTVQMGGINSRLNINGDQSGQFSLDVGELSVDASSEGFQFDLSGATMNFSSEQFNDVFAPSSTRMEVPLVSSRAPIPFSVQGVVVDSQIRQSSVGQGRTDIYQLMAVEQVEADFPLQSLNWTFEINEIHPELAAGYSEFATDLQAQASSGDLTAVTGQLNAFSQELTMLLVQNSLVFNNLIDTNAYNGNHKVDLRVRWNGIPTATDMSRLDFNEIINALTVSVQLDLDEKAALKSPGGEFLYSFTQEGMLQLENGRIKLDGSLQNGELVFNGEVYPVDQFVNL